MLGQNASLRKYLSIEISQSVSSNHNEIKLEINKKNVTRKSPTAQQLSNVLPNNPWITEEIKIKVGKCFSQNDNKTSKNIRNTTNGAQT